MYFINILMGQTVRWRYIITTVKVMHGKRVNKLAELIRVLKWE